MRIFTFMRPLYSQIDYFRTAIDLNKEDRAKRFNKYSIFNLQSSIPACPGWDAFNIGVYY
ncbi:hypothetical protein D1AOALGA4SA_8163 [Olavius algarvensis Delta 1 endosymbiont]|nr:hypothetical protein D1AOALGA4SA_8163 [Olavius algarvensis Delta 1 endosymbiont]